MTTEQPKAKPARDRQFTGVFALIMTALVCAVLVLSTSRAILPRSLPVLVLDPARVQLALAADRDLLSKVPKGADIDELETHYLEQGELEIQGPVQKSHVDRSQYALRLFAHNVFARVGKQGRMALRARALSRFMSVLSGAEARDQHAAAVLGTFPQLLRTYGLIDDEGQLSAPDLCVRTSFKARWNVIFGLPLTQDFSVVEVQAFQGWLALHAGAAAQDRRLEAAIAFHAAGGHRSHQALATWLVSANRYADARNLMQKAYFLRPELATRNYELGIASSQ